LFKTFYLLREVAGMYNRGSSHFANNTCSDVIKNPKEVTRINEIILPAIFEEMYIILERNQNNETLYRELVEIDLLGDTSKTLEFFKTTHFKTDDLKELNEKSEVKLLSEDLSRIHSVYWDDYHKNKKK